MERVYEIRPYTPLHGYPYGVPGIYFMADGRAKPWRVKYLRKRRSVHIGCFQSLRDAQKAAMDFLKSEVRCAYK